MELTVKLQAFEGPLDLLLHLIEKNKVDIYDIPIVLITDQYLEYVNAMEREDLNLVSEFLVMAATLIDIKTKMLLPKIVDESGEEIDPRAELVEQLIEYKTFRHMSEELREKQKYSGKSMYKEPDIPKEVLKYQPPVNLDKLLENVTLEKMNKIFIQVMKRMDDKMDPLRSGFGKIEKEEISLPDKISYIKQYTRNKLKQTKGEKFSFKELLENQESKMDVIVTFLAVLELMKMGQLHIEQKHTFDDIMITAGEKVKK